MNVIKIRNGERETKNKNWDRKYSGNPHNSLKWRTTTRKKGLNRRLSFPAPHFRFLVQRSPLSVPHSPYSVLLSALPVPVFSNIHKKQNFWMLDKVPIDPQQAIKRESPFTDETDLILSLFEVRLNILMTIFCARVTKVVYSLWYCLYLVPKEKKYLHCCFVKDMRRIMWSC